MTGTADYGGLAVRKKSKKTFESTLAKELEISSQTSRSGAGSNRSDARRRVEDLLEIKRYKVMHEDFFE